CDAGGELDRAVAARCPLPPAAQRPRRSLGGGRMRRPDRSSSVSGAAAVRARSHRAPSWIDLALGGPELQLPVAKPVRPLERKQATAAGDQLARVARRSPRLFDERFARVPIDLLQRRTADRALAERQRSSS